MLFDFNVSLDIMDLVVIVSLFVVLYTLRTIKQIEDALAVVFISLNEMTKGNPVVFDVDEDGELNVSFPLKKEDEDAE